MNSEPVVELVSLDDLRDWSLSPDFQLSHRSGGFYRYQAINFYLDVMAEPEIRIVQNEIGLLLCAVHANPNDLSDCLVSVQNKFEPGNHPKYQLSPSLQKTFSNIRGLHGGSPIQSDSLLNHPKTKPLSITLQSEQSDSYLHKKNLNALVYCDKESSFVEEQIPSCSWVSLGDLVSLLLQSRKVHIDLRSVIFPLLLQVFDKTYRKHSIHSCTLNDRLNQLYLNLATFSMNAQRPWCYVPMDQACNYIDGTLVVRGEQNARILGVSVTCSDREVSTWSQPLLALPEKSFALVVCKQSGEYHLLAALSCAPGSMSEPELLPSFTSFGDPSDLDHQLTSDFQLTKVHSSTQTEEGGRFWNRSNHYLIYEAEWFNPPAQTQWIPLYLLHHVYEHSAIVSIELRSACVLWLSMMLKK